MLIVLEGTDRAGKTTLADALEASWRQSKAADLREPEVRRLHKGPPGRENIMLQYEFELEVRLAPILSLSTLVICDRWHVGELIYGPELRGECRLTGPQVVHIEMLLTALGAVKVMCDTSEKELSRRWQAEQRNELIGAAFALEARDRYAAHADKWDWQWSLPGWEAGKLEVLLSLAERNTRRALRLASIGGYVGAAWPWTVLVGDQPGDGIRADARFSLRAFTPGRQSSSASYLMACLEVTGLWRTAGVVNSNVDLKGIEEVLKPQRFVALGKKASARLTQAGIEHESVPHPQYQRRFKFWQQSDYAEKLKGE
jgi:hypothetical protein